MSLKKKAWARILRATHSLALLKGDDLIFHDVPDKNKLILRHISTPKTLKKHNKHIAKHILGLKQPKKVPENQQSTQNQIYLWAKIYHIMQVYGKKNT